jgi:beta-barrel assembly-enhancing protease
VTRKRLRRVFALAALASVLTACGTLSVEDEKKLGARYQTQLRKELTFVRDPVSVNYVRQFGAQLAAAARPSPFEFRFYLVEDEEINAFAIPGGAMYVNTGLLLAVHNGAELASVLAHEMGHVTARHIAKNANTQRNTGFVANIFYIAVAILTGNPYLANAGGLAGQVAGQAFVTTFTRDAEREADQLAVETMVNAGWNPNGMVTMFETLKKEGGGSSSMPQFLSSHPATDERIENTEKEIEKYPNADKLRLDDPKLPIIQERLKLIIGTDREKEDKSDGDESDDEE